MDSGLPAAQVASVRLASTGIAAVGQTALVVWAAGRHRLSGLDSAVANRLLHVGWTSRWHYAIGWATQLGLNLLLTGRAALAAGGIPLFLGLGVLLTARLLQSQRAASLPAAPGLYLSGVKLASVVFWVESQRSFAGVPG